MTDAPEADGLATPEVGRWSKRKYHFLSRYLTLFSTGMKNKWPQRHYIDLFAGAGIARLRGTDELAYGSPLIAARVNDPFTQLHVCEQSPANVDALRRRLTRYPQPNEPRIIQGDANEVVHQLLSGVPPKRALAITFADPFGLHLHFETIRAVSDRRSDLIILLADNMDALRNWLPYYHDNPDSNLDRFMGESGWRDVLQESATPERLRARYQERLGSIGYEHFGFERVQNDHGHDIYSLVYATKHKRGLDFWEKARQVDEGGQRSLFSGQ